MVLINPLVGHRGIYAYSFVKDEMTAGAYKSEYVSGDGISEIFFTIFRKLTYNQDRASSTQ